LNEDNSPRSYAILPDKKNSTVAPVLENMSRNLEGRGCEVEVMYTDNKCCQGTANILLECIPSLKKWAGRYPPLDSDQVAAERKIPIYKRPVLEELILIKHRATVPMFVETIISALPEDSRVIFVKCQWNLEGQYAKRVATLTITVPNNTESPTYIFHLSQLTNNFSQFISFPQSLKQLLEDESICKYGLNIGIDQSLLLSNFNIKLACIVI
jgi:hypothetical protein